MEQNASDNKKILEGIVVSDSMDKTVVVRVERLVKHPKYRKFMKRSKKYKAHDEHNTHHVGDAVAIAPSRPYAKDVHFVVVEK